MSDSILTRGPQGDEEAQGLSRGISAMVIGAFGQLLFVTIPFFLAFVKQDRSFSDSQISLVGSADMAGMFIASLVATLWIRAVNWRGAAAMALVALIGITATSMATYEFMPFVLTRVAAGFASGSLMAIGMTAMGDRHRADAWFGWYLAFLSTIGMVTAYLIPRVIQTHGLHGFFYALIGIYTLLLPICLFTPRGPRQRSALSPSEARRASIPLAIVSLIAIHLFGMSIFAVWSHLQLLGEQSNFAPENAGDAMSLAYLLGIPASIAAGMLTGHVRRIWLFTGFAVCHLVGLLLMITGPQLWSFQLAIVMLGVGWSFGSPLQVGLTASLDPTGRFVVLFVASMKASYVVAGAALAALLAANSALSVVALFSLVTGLTSLAAYCFLSLRAPGLALASPLEARPSIRQVP